MDIIGHFGVGNPRCKCNPFSSTISHLSQDGNCSGTACDPFTHQIRVKIEAPSASHTPRVLVQWRGMRSNRRDRRSSRGIRCGPPAIYE
jgi:hypothetical protein